MSLRTMSLRTRLSAAAVGAVFAVGAAALPAHAASGEPGAAALTAAKAKVTDGLTDRLSTLTELQTRLAGAKDVPDGARGTLTSLLSSDISGAAKTAREDLRKAVADAKKVRDAIKSTGTKGGSQG